MGLRFGDGGNVVFVFLFAAGLVQLLDCEWMEPDVGAMAGIFWDCCGLGLWESCDGHLFVVCCGSNCQVDDVGPDSRFIAVGCETSGLVFTFQESGHWGWT